MNIARSARTVPHSFRFAFLALWLCAAWQSAAAALPDASGTFNTNVSNTFFVFPASASFACGTASISATPLPALSVSGSDCPDGLQAILNYYFQIIGPAGTLVPVSVASAHSLAASGSAQAGFSLTVANQTIDIGNCYFASLAACGSHDSFTTLSLMANQIYGVSMMTIIANNLGPGAGAAFLDPRFDFAAGFANAADYKFEFSAGIGNGSVTAVPEPQPLSTMLLGLASLAGMARLQRRRSR
jgi:MYXO-CTERM domain-containing protein